MAGVVRGGVWGGDAEGHWGGAVGWMPWELVLVDNAVGGTLEADAMGGHTRRGCGRGVVGKGSEAFGDSEGRASSLGYPIVPLA